MAQDELFDGGPRMKRCTDCRELKPLDEFHRHRGKRDGRQTGCRACNIALNKQWYKDHPEARAERMDGYAKVRRRDNQRRIYEYLLDHSCVDCGESDPVVLDFDHLRDKVANVTAMLGSPWHKILAEIAKCEVRCANCHRRATARRLGSFRATYVAHEGETT